MASRNAWSLSRVSPEAVFPTRAAAGATRSGAGAAAAAAGGGGEGPSHGASGPPWP